MYNRDIMNSLCISFDNLNKFYQFYNKLNPKKTKEFLLMRYFPELVSPAPKCRLDSIENHIIGEKLMDVGLGIGWIEFYFKRRKNWDILGNDMSENSLNDAKMLFEFFGIKIPLFKFNITNLPFKDKSFDNVICSSVLEHLPNMGLLNKTINEVSRVLKPQGILIAVIPNGFGSHSVLADRIMRRWIVLSGKNIDKSIEHYHYHLYGFKKWVTIIERNGFNFIDAENQWFVLNYFKLLLGILHVKNESVLYNFSSAVQKIANLIPHILSTGWIMAFGKFNNEKEMKNGE